MEAMTRLVTSNGTERVRAHDLNTAKSQSSGALPSRSPHRWSFRSPRLGRTSSASGMGGGEPGGRRSAQVGARHSGHLRQHRGAWYDDKLECARHPSEPRTGLTILDPRGMDEVGTVTLLPVAQRGSGGAGG
uniref:Uncharacterized protein n=1 Tax=Molossus molossus TaxID=27622 RepID=A0A7J8I8H6_MOLMO|nr:hypothetical protein HJG59_010678 [Molossus molossus]